MRRSFAFELPEKAPVARSHTAVLHLALMLITRSDYRWIAYGEVSPEKAVRFVERMMEQYLVHLPSEALASRRKAGLPVTRLILAPHVEELPHYKDGVRRPVVPYLILSTKDLKGLNLYPIKSKKARPWGRRGRGNELRIFPHSRPDRDRGRGPSLAYTWRGKYVLGLRPRYSGKNADKPFVYTWFLTNWEFERWSVALTQAARDGDLRALRKLFAYLTEYPRFAGVRKDLKALIRAASKAFEPHRRRADGRRLTFPLPDELRELEPIRAVPIWNDPPRTLGDVLSEAQG